MAATKDFIDQIEALTKAMEAGSYDTAPSTLTQGASLQIEDLSPVMQVVTWDDSRIKLQKLLKAESCKSTLAQFDRQLSYGMFGGAAQFEGNIGQEETDDFVRITVPMCYYSHMRRVTVVSDMVATVDGKKASDRAASSAAKKIAGDLEFDLFRGLADFSNGGVFDGSPAAMGILPNIHGLDLQVRQSDSQLNARDQMFNEYGSDDSVVIPVGGTLRQDSIEDSRTRSEMNHGDAEALLLDPKSLSAYNKITYSKERIVLGGAPADVTGAELSRQNTSFGTVKIQSSRFLSGKTKPARARANGPSQPTLTSVTSTTTAGVTTPFTLGQSYAYYVTAGNEVGESTGSSSTTATVATAGDTMNLVITPGSGTNRYFNVYRSDAGGTSSSARFIGRVANSGAGTTTFVDAGNKSPGFVTGFLYQSDTMVMKDLAPYSRLKLAVTDLSTPEGHFRFTTLAVMQPRKNVLLDNITG
jgi:hypothetical protein